MAEFCSGSVCRDPGTYMSDCDCAHVEPLRAGGVFPACRGCGADVFWMFIVGS